MDKTMEIKYEIFGEVLRDAKDLAKTAISIKQSNEDLEISYFKNDEEGKEAVFYELLNREMMVYDCLTSLLQKLGTIEDLNELLRNSHENHIFDLEFELNYKNKEEK